MDSADKGTKSLVQEAVIAEISQRVECHAIRRARLFRSQLERAVEVLEQTRQSFRSKQLKRLREEIEDVLKSS